MGVCGRANCKNWRSQENRRYRAYSKNLLRHGEYDNIMSYKKKWQNPWDGPKDGSYWFGDLRYIECCSRVCIKWGIKVTYCDPDEDYHRCEFEYFEMMRK